MSESLPNNTPIEVIATKNGKNFKELMPLEKWKSLDRKPGFTYSAYQVGFSQFVTEN